MRFLSIVLLFIVLNSCITQEKTDKRNLVPLVSIDSILSSEDNFAKYFFLDVNLDDPYKAFNINNQSLSRHDFLSSLESGNYVPIKVQNSLDSITSFQIVELDSLQRQKFSKFLKAKGNQYASFEKFLNNELPNFDFTDLKNVKHDRNTIMNKIVVVKFWFIGCKPCIDEMPALNELVKQYENRKDIIFLSFALDKPDQLRSFLTRTQFDYSIIPDSQNYVMDTLNINVFPTHMILNQEGLIIAVSANAKKLKEQLEKYVKL